MTKQAARTLLFTHTHCYFIFIVVLFSASETAKLEKAVSSPENIASRFEMFDLHANANEKRTFLGRDAWAYEKQFEKKKDRESIFPQSFADATEISIQKAYTIPKRSRRSKSLVDRMPMSFGKKAAGGLSIPLHLAVDKVEPCQTLDKDLKCHEWLTHVDASELSNTFQNLKDSQNDRDKILRSTRGRLERMPLTYGKRAAEINVPKTDQISDSFLDSDIFTVSARHKLDRMPNFFGKRFRSSPQNSIDSSLYESDIDNDTSLKPEAKNSYLFMKSTLGEIEKMNEVKSYESNQRKRWSRIDRMPLTYGKRGDSQNSHYLRPLYPRLGLPSLFKHKNARKYDEATYKNVRKAQQVLPNNIPSTVPSFTSDYINHQVVEGLDPLFSKLFGADPARYSTPISKNYVDLEPQQSFSNRPTVYTMKRFRPVSVKRGKSGVVYIDIPFLMRQLRVQKTKMSPEDYKRFRTEALSVMNRYLIGDAHLTRSSRSRLGRMPLTYGKRSGDGDRRRLTDMERLESKSQPAVIPSLKRRSRMDRMPLSYGKRTFQDNTLPSSFEPQRLYSKDNAKVPERLNGPSNSASWAALGGAPLSRNLQHQQQQQQQQRHSEGLDSGMVSPIYSANVNVDEDKDLDDVNEESSTTSLSYPKFLTLRSQENVNEGL